MKRIYEPQNKQAAHIFCEPIQRTEDAMPPRQIDRLQLSRETLA